jgi:hypothetical protein
MYNGQVNVDATAEARAVAQGNYFDSTTGAYLLEVGDVVEVVFQNQVGINNVVTIHSDICMVGISGTWVARKDNSRKMLTKPFSKKLIRFIEIPLS